MPDQQDQFLSTYKKEASTSKKTWHIILLIVFFLGVIVSIFYFFSSLGQSSQSNKIEDISDVQTSLSREMSRPLETLESRYPANFSGYGVVQVKTYDSYDEAIFVGDLVEVTPTEIKVQYLPSEPLFSVLYDESLEIFPQDLSNTFPSEWYSLTKEEFLNNVMAAYADDSHSIKVYLDVFPDSLNYKAKIVEVVAKPEQVVPLETPVSDVNTVEEGF